MAEWNFNCPNCIYSKSGMACDSSACTYRPIVVVAGMSADHKQGRTNRNYLESLSDEEFAGYLSTHNFTYTRYEEVLEWLQAEHEEADNG